MARARGAPGLLAGLQPAAWLEETDRADGTLGLLARTIGGQHGESAPPDLPHVPTPETPEGCAGLWTLLLGAVTATPMEAIADVGARPRTTADIRPHD